MDGKNADCTEGNTRAVVTDFRSDEKHFAKNNLQAKLTKNMLSSCVFSQKAN